LPLKSLIGDQNALQIPLLLWGITAMEIYRLVHFLLTGLRSAGPISINHAYVFHQGGGTHGRVSKFPSGIRAKAAFDNLVRGARVSDSARIKPATDESDMVDHHDRLGETLIFVNSHRLRSPKPAFEPSRQHWLSCGNVGQVE